MGICPLALVKCVQLIELVLRLPVWYDSFWLELEDAIFDFNDSFSASSEAKRTFNIFSSGAVEVKAISLLSSANNFDVNKAAPSLNNKFCCVSLLIGITGKFELTKIDVVMVKNSEINKFVFILLSTELTLYLKILFPLTNHHNYYTNCLEISGINKNLICFLTNLFIKIIKALN
ncbi:hypothetical protein B1H10_06535 [candidate division KSB1 bacterium 4484_188]|nr:MAG: hypothetical protein B1H10_06535 [candidate division KSB1 bacterium 4484_188]